MSDSVMPDFSCALPITKRDTVVLGHGSGGRLSHELMRDVFLPAFANPVLNRLDDQAQLELPSGRVAFTTDTFVVKPLVFPGGDIGSLAVHGTINDLAMAGAKPVALSAAFVLEEGLPMAVLTRIVESMARAARQAGVPVVTGDTKVVERGAADGVFINTSGIGVVPDGIRLSASQARVGDAVILSGTLGDHGITILSAREGLSFETSLQSDSAALHTLVDALFAAVPAQAVHVLRDPTRGGLSSTLHEIAEASGIGFHIDETRIPLRDEVRGACELLGLDPLYVANEGKLVAIVDAQHAGAALAALRTHPLGANAAIIGDVVAETRPPVVARTELGTRRVVDLLSADQLPRIC